MRCWRRPPSSSGTRLPSRTGTHPAHAHPSPPSSVKTAGNERVDDGALFMASPLAPANTCDAASKYLACLDLAAIPHRTVRDTTFRLPNLCPKLRTAILTRGFHELSFPLAPPSRTGRRGRSWRAWARGGAGCCPRGTPPGCRRCWPRCARWRRPPSPLGWGAALTNPCCLRARRAHPSAR